MEPSNWMPSASMQQLKQRADLLKQIRHFFEQRDVMEVETPVISHAGITDIHLCTFQTTFVGPSYAKGCLLHLMTSPEFHMKRLLAAGSGSIYQMSKVFRNEENGRYHNPEFTLLEWYRVGFSLHDLMDEIEALLSLVLTKGKASRMTYQQAFLSILGLCPLEASVDDLKYAANLLGLKDIAEREQDRDTLLQLLFSFGIEPYIGQESPVFVYNFPASQAALAKINQQDDRVADRFEIYFKGVELANGFHELDDPEEQLARFEADNKKRTKMGLIPQPIDYHLIDALRAGLPSCSGVALGVDRLMMLALAQDHIDKVIAFPFPNA